MSGSVMITENSDPTEPGTNGSATSARQRVYDGLCSGILRGGFPLGGFIVESMATRKTGVSRSPVREALTRLAAEFFLVLHPRRGAMVKPISTVEFSDLYDVRLMVASHAVRRMCRDNLTVSLLLFDLCNEHDRIAEGDHLAFADLNHRCHCTIVGAAENAVLCQVFENLRANLTRVAALSFQLGVTKVREGTLHRELADALAAWDEEWALTMMREHIGKMPRVVTSLSGARQSEKVNSGQDSGK